MSTTAPMPKGTDPIAVASPVVGSISYNSSGIATLPQKGIELGHPGPALATKILHPCIVRGVELSAGLPNGLVSHIHCPIRVRGAQDKRTGGDTRILRKQRCGTGQWINSKNAVREIGCIDLSI